MSEFAVGQIDRLVQDAESAQGMRAGLPKAHVDTSLLRHLILHYQRLEAEVAGLWEEIKRLQENGKTNREQFAEEVAALKAWKEAVIDQLMVTHIYATVHETDPRRAINDLVSYMCTVALDPSVSSDAAALVERGKAQADEVLKAHHKAETLQRHLGRIRAVVEEQKENEPHWSASSAHKEDFYEPALRELHNVITETQP